MHPLYHTLPTQTHNARNASHATPRHATQCHATPRHMPYATAPTRWRAHNQRRPCGQRHQNVPQADRALVPHGRPLGCPRGSSEPPAHGSTVQVENEGCAGAALLQCQASEEVLGEAARWTRCAEAREKNMEREREGVGWRGGAHVRVAHMGVHRVQGGGEQPGVGSTSCRDGPELDLQQRNRPATDLDDVLVCDSHRRANHRGVVAADELHLRCTDGVPPNKERGWGGGGKHRPLPAHQGRSLQSAGMPLPRVGARTHACEHSSTKHTSVTTMHTSGASSQASLAPACTGRSVVTK
jgi:hypothetical protein